MDNTLYKKLKIDKFNKIILINKPKEITPFDGMDEISHFDLGNVDNKTEISDLIISYVYSLEAMKNIIMEIKNKSILNKNGQIYLIYPKNKNKLNHEPIGRDSIFPYLEVDEDSGFVKNTEYKFNKMVALDENYTLIGLKHDSKIVNKSKKYPSQRVDDYVDFVDKIEEFLREYPIQLEFYKSLTPGYKKDWARYIFSARTEATVEKRKDEMVRILGEGFKTKQLYLSKKKGK